MRQQQHPGNPVEQKESITVNTQELGVVLEKVLDPFVNWKWHFFRMSKSMVRQKGRSTNLLKVMLDPFLH